MLQFNTFLALFGFMTYLTYVDDCQGESICEATAETVSYT